MYLFLETCPIEKGFCVLPNGGDQNGGVIKLNNVDGDTEQAQATCLDLCKKRADATGCEVIWHQGNRGCYVHTQTVARGNGAARHMCWIFSKCKAPQSVTPEPGIVFRLKKTVTLSFLFYNAMSRVTVLVKQLLWSRVTALHKFSSI